MQGGMSEGIGNRRRRTRGPQNGLKVANDTPKNKKGSPKDSGLP